MTIPIHTVDAFADAPFEGNPAAVCFPPDGVSDAWLQSVAAEMALSETAFLWPRGDAWAIRWMTPATEVRLCGHATLASAHVLFATGRAEGVVRFETRSAGPLEARADGGRIALDFPASPPEDAPPPPGLFEALGAEGPTLRVHDDTMVVLDDADAVRALTPDFRRLLAVDARAVLVTAKGEGEHDFVSRFFAPRAGIDEDPVTGSAHCALAPFWARELGRDALRGRQLSARGGTVDVELRGDRVTLRGRAFEVLRGALLLDP